MKEPERVFAEPWEARLFALVLALQERGAVPWRRFQERLVQEVQGGAERSYYGHWLAAAEALLAEQGLLDPDETETEMARLRPEDRTVRLRG